MKGELELTPDSILRVLSIDVKVNRLEVVKPKKMFLVKKIPKR